MGCLFQGIFRHTLSNLVALSNLVGVPLTWFSSCFANDPCGWTVDKDTVARMKYRFRLACSVDYQTILSLSIAPPPPPPQGLPILIIKCWYYFFLLNCFVRKIPWKIDFWYLLHFWFVIFINKRPWVPELNNDEWDTFPNIPSLCIHYGNWNMFWLSIPSLSPRYGNWNMFWLSIPYLSLHCGNWNIFWLSIPFYPFTVVIGICCDCLSLRYPFTVVIGICFDCLVLLYAFTVVIGICTHMQTS